MTRPEIYFGEVTNNDVYVNTRQQEFNYPQGDTDSVTSYEGHRRHHPRRAAAALAHRTRPWRHHPAAVQRRRARRKPAADAAQHPRARAGAGAVPHLRFRSLHRDRRSRTVVLDAGRLHDVRHVSVLAPLPPRSVPPELRAEQREGRRGRLQRDRWTSTSSTRRIRSSRCTGGFSRACSSDADEMPPALRQHVRYPELNCSRYRPPSTACIT